MPKTPNPAMIARCACGGVELEAFGAPIASVVCYCDDCQEGARRLELLPDAGPVADPDGGAAYVLYRTDRVRYAKGAHLLEAHKIEAASPTNRLVAACCHAAMAMTFDDTRHWTPVFRARFQGEPPPLQWRICTKFKSAGVPLPGDAPSSAGYPFGFMARLLTSFAAMRLGR